MLLTLVHDTDPSIISLLASLLLCGFAPIALAAPVQLDISRAHLIDLGSNFPGNGLGIGPQISHQKREAEAVFPGQFDDPRKQGWRWHQPADIKRTVIDISQHGGRVPEDLIGLKEKRDAEAIVVPWGSPSINPADCDDPLICAALKKRDAAAEPVMLLPGMKSINPAGCTQPWCASH